jgi:hypothetical protein
LYSAFVAGELAVLLEVEVKVDIVTTCLQVLLDVQRRVERDRLLRGNNQTVLQVRVLLLHKDIQGLSKLRHH